MHILIIHQAFASLDESGGTRHYEFARLLAANGHPVTIIGSPVSYLTGVISGSDAEGSDQKTVSEGQKVENLTILRAKVYSAHHRSFFHRIIAFVTFMFSSFLLGIKVKDVDLVWGTSPPIFQGVTAWALARMKRVPFLLEIRDLWPLFAVAVGVLKNPILVGASEWLERNLYQRAGAVMINSPGFMDHVISRGARRVELIPNGSDPAMFDPGKDGGVFRAAHNLEGKFVVLYAGAHGISNDLEVVLESASLISNARIQIVLLGDGKEKRNLQDRAKELGLNNVIFLPPIPKSKIPEALAATDACLAILKPLPEYKTTYPNKVFDYMAAGRPVILAIDGVIRGVIDEAGCGIFVEPGDPDSLAKAIDQLAVDPARGRKMGLAGQEYLENHFSRAKIGKRLIQFLEELV